MNKLTFLEIIRQINALERIDFEIYECKKKKKEVPVERS